MEQLIEKIKVAFSSSQFEWRDPHCAPIGDDGSIDIEWYKDERYLMIFTDGDGISFATTSRIEYITVWGTNIENEMDCGNVDLDNCSHLWDWLNGLKEAKSD